MQRVPTALAKPSTVVSPKALVPTSTVPHSEARASVPSSWAWSEPNSTPSTQRTVSSFAPLGYERGYQYPLLVWLHGDGACEQSLPSVMRHISVRNFVAVAPRGTTAIGEGHGWDLSSDDADDAVFDAIEAASCKFSLHPRRVFLAGSGAGGATAMRVGLRHPDRFAGVATLDGKLPRGRCLLSRADELRDLPLLLSSSKESAGYSESDVCHDLKLLHATGCRVAVRQYPGDDDLTTAMLADLNRWVMDIVCG